MLTIYMTSASDSSRHATHATCCIPHI